MPIITAVEAKSRWVKFVYLCIYIVLTIGALTMIYPMMLMISGSVKSETDITTMDPIPKFLFDDDILYRKYMENKYSGQIKLYQRTYKNDSKAWRQIPVFKEIGDEKLVECYKIFREKYAQNIWQFLGFGQSPSRLSFHNVRGFRKFLERQFGPIEKLNESFNTAYNSYQEIYPLDYAEMVSRRYRPAKTEFYKLYVEYKMSRPANERIFVDLDGYYQQMYLKPIYININKYNKSHGTNFKSFSEIPLSVKAPTNEAMRKDWERFVRQELNLVYIKLDKNQANKYREFLKSHYKDIKSVNKLYNRKYKAFSQISFPTSMPINPVIATDWDLFIRKKVDLDAISIYGPRQAFEKVLKQENYPTKNSLSEMTKARIFTDISDFNRLKKAFKWECLKMNYLTVLDYILLHGRGVVNTIIYCSLLILAQLIVNPLAAYAMSRYKLPSTYKILLFCMATMAFPPAVTMIPAFLLLRKLNLLNTFAALILPAMANGYWIFMLKGFFDSLPQELYEAADIDGATEWKKFWIITMSLSKPVLAVVALQAFTIAYANFMAALIIIPDQKMWTLMIWLYQLQTFSHQGIVYAALCLAAIPTFLVFLFAQGIIMRGIVVPVEK